MVVWNILYHFLIRWKDCRGRLGEFLHGTYSGISNPQPGLSRYFTERTLLTTHNAMADELNHSILDKFSGVTHTFAGYDKVIHETQGQVNTPC
jgi:hypothetical protein